MDNEYQTLGPITVIQLTPHNGKSYSCIIDTVNLDIAKSIDGNWYVMIHGRTKQPYARAFQGKGNPQPLLHRLIMDPPQGYNCGHRNGNTLDNREENLVNVKIGEDPKEY